MHTARAQGALEQCVEAAGRVGTALRRLQGQPLDIVRQGLWRQAKDLRRHVTHELVLMLLLQQCTDTQRLNRASWNPAGGCSPAAGNMISRQHFEPCKKAISGQPCQQDCTCATKSREMLCPATAGTGGRCPGDTPRPRSAGCSPPPRPPAG